MTEYSIAARIARVNRDDEGRVEEVRVETDSGRNYVFQVEEGDSAFGQLPEHGVGRIRLEFEVPPPVELVPVAETTEEAGIQPGAGRRKPSRKSDA